MRAIPLFGSERQLPGMIAGLAFEHVICYPDPKLGVSIRYGTPAIAKGEAYLYDYGLSDISDEIKSPRVLEWFQYACQAVTDAAEQGLYKDFEVLTSQYLHLPPDSTDPFCLWASFVYRQTPGPNVSYEGRRVSNLALRIDRGYINKVRYTHPEEAGEEGLTGFLAFLVEWTDLVSKAPREKKAGGGWR